MTLRQCRRARGLGQKALAERLGITQAAVARQEGRPIQRLRLSTVHRYVAALGGELVLEVGKWESGGQLTGGGNVRSREGL